MGKKRKVHSLTGRIDDRLMMQAFKAVKKNRGAAGIDKVSIGMFQQNLDANLAALKRDLKKGCFQPQATAASVDSQRRQGNQVQTARHSGCQRSRGAGSDT